MKIRSWVALPVIALALSVPAAAVEATVAPSSGAETTPAAPPAPQPPKAGPVRQPRLVLVLSGGGARGAAHLGVLKVLEELHVPVDMIVGTSMGSIVGGLYATGWSPAEGEALLRDINWKKVFFDRLDREEKSYVRRQDDTRYYIKAKIRFKGWKPYLPMGILGGQRLELLMKSLEFESTDSTNFDDFPIPYRAVAADLTENVPYVIDHGSLATAMRASMSIAGAFSPVEIDGHLLVDGGAVANLPIGIAIDLGAQSVIAVDISSPLSDRDDIGSFLSVMNQMSGLLTTGNRSIDLKRLRPGDVLIRPDLGDISFSDFQRATDAVAIGEQAARASIDKLKKFAVGDAEWAAYMAKRHRPPSQDILIEKVEFENTSPVSDEIVKAHLPLVPGKRFDQNAFSDDVMHLYGLEYFGPIRPTLVRTTDKASVSLVVPPKSYGRASVQLGFSFNTDLEGESGTTITARHLLLAVNRSGGEWENIIQVGERMTLASQFYQPLDAAMKWFVSPGFHATKWLQGLWSEGQHVADYRVKEWEAHVDAGRVFGRWGELRGGVFYRSGDGVVAVGTELLPDATAVDSGVQIGFNTDTLDSTVFPRHGWRVRSRYAKSLESFGSDAANRQVTVEAMAAIKLGKNTLVPMISWYDNLDEPTNFANLFSLGGLWRLSGLGRNELIGERAALANVVFYRELMNVGLGALKTAVYFGGSAELGNTFTKDEALTVDNMRVAGSVFIGADTVIGPAYLAWGISESGRRRYYFCIGQSF